MTDKYDDFRKKLCDNEYSIAYVKREIAGSTWTAEQKEIATPLAARAVGTLH